MKLFLWVIMFFPISMYTQNVSTNFLENSVKSNSGFLDAFYEGEDTTPQDQTRENTIWVLFRIIFITSVLGFLTWFIIRFFFRSNRPVLHTNSSVEVLAMISAGLGSYFVIAKLYQSYYFLSLSSDGLRVLDKISDQETIDFIELNREDRLSHDTKFIDLLEKIPNSAPKRALDFLREKIDKLRKM